MAELAAAAPMKSELEALLASAKERAAAEQEVTAEFTSSFDDPEYELQKHLKKIGSQFDQQLEEAQQKWEQSRTAIVQQFEQEENTIRTQQAAELREIELEYGNEQEAADKEKADASWMVTSVLDDNCARQPAVPVRNVQETPDRHQGPAGSATPRNGRSGQGHDRADAGPPPVAGRE